MRSGIADVPIPAMLAKLWGSAALATAPASELDAGHRPCLRPDSATDGGDQAEPQPGRPTKFLRVFRETAPRRKFGSSFYRK